MRLAVALLLASSLVATMAARFASSPAETPEAGQARQDSAAGMTKLRSELEKLIAGFEGEVGIYVKHLSRGEELAVRADETFPSASLVKVPILLKIFDRLERDELKYAAKQTYDRAKRRYAGEDVVASFADGEKIALSKLVDLMISYSDNTASLWLQDLAGTGTAVNDWLEKKGFATTRVNSRTPGRKKAYGKWGWGQTTPREMARCLELIRKQKAVSPAADEEMYRVLCRSYWDGEALSAVPPQIQVASKQGAVSHSRSEVALVNAPSGDYLFCVITKNQKDKSWGDDNEGFVLLRRVSALLWRHFEPRHPYAAAGGVERYR
jgi:beta-lactamase class A